LNHDRKQGGNGDLTPRQKQFVAEYLLDLNATQAAIRAGYSPRTAPAQASRLLTNVKVSKAIAQAVEERAQRTAVDQDWVLGCLQEVVDRCMQTVPVNDRQGKPTGEFRFNAAGATRALEIIGKHLRMFSDKADDQRFRDVEELSTEELMVIAASGLDIKGSSSEEDLSQSIGRRVFGHAGS
jgi:phage terminase small subunit